jgi:hypothetical protein
MRKRKPASRKVSEKRPSDTRPLTAAAKYRPPQAQQSMSKSAHRPKISGHRVIAIVSQQNAPQPGSYLGYRRMHPLAQHLLNLLQLRHHPLLRRLPPDHEPALGVPATLMHEPQKRERLRFPLAPAAPVPGRQPAELQHPRLPGCSSSPNFASRSRNSARNRSASACCSTPLPDHPRNGP